MTATTQTTQDELNLPVEYKDLSNYSSQDIKLLIDASTQRLKKKELEDRDESLLMIVELVKKNKIPFDEIVSILGESHAVYSCTSENGRTRKLYIDPQNPKNTWHGVGRRPSWIVAKIEMGLDIESLAVEIEVDDAQQEFFYFNPNSHTQRWSGSGRKPAWFKELEQANIDVEKYKTMF
ncbi:H-NS family nucleoid-associated regulatory protein [Acinetobacter sp. P1(2025)]|uniref:H-NS family nucleoid-associated regulatory protein n=1 Tax=Acinetobacter sp. P1(2025) TaxID=3446120 RepID=UPI003F529C03